MKTLGFKNFRKFINFPDISLGGINILVGGNNSGKSTVVKAMLLIQEFLKNKIDFTKNNIFSVLEPDFYFDTEHVNIGNFERAFCKFSPSEEDTIVFNLGFREFLFSVSIRGDRDKREALPHVTHLVITDTLKNVTFTFDYSKNLMTANFGIDEQTRQSSEKYDAIVAEIEVCNQRINQSKDLNEIAELKLTIEQKSKVLTTLKDLPSAIEESVSMQMVEFIGDNFGKLLIPELVHGFAHYSSTGTTGDKRTKEYAIEVNNKAILNKHKEVIVDIANRLSSTILSKKIEYIYAHSVSQQAFYLAKDSNDYSAKVIREFYKAKISKQDSEYMFILKWMKIFEIGLDFNVEATKGEVYQVTITDLENHNIDLADKGMGSIQMMILFLRLATLMRKYKDQNLTILLEEPEQNLHPALQSQLATLLYEVNKEYNFQFVVETHSEYLVRNTQVIVARDFSSDELLEQNPFRVYFMPKFASPYNMGYKTNGRFSEKFDSGFFDEAGKANNYLMRKERGML